MKINEMKILGLNYFQFLFLFHIFIVTSILLFVGFSRNNTPNWFYNLLGILGVIIILYHTYRLFTHGLRDYQWNYFHVLVVAPILLYTAYMKTKTPNIIYDFYIIMGFGAFGINIYKLLK